MKLVPTAALTLGVTLGGAQAHAIEEPVFQIVQKYDAFEIRDYQPYVVAEVVVPGPAEEAGNQGFRILAAYIFGKNKGERNIEMTAPVTQTPVPARLEMTAPVTQSATDAGFAIQFKMPASYTLESLPEPLDARIKLKVLPGGRFAVIRYSGSWSESNYSTHLERLNAGVTAAGLTTTGAPIYSRYNAPFVPWFMRRNEIWLSLN
ncbi:heme-binding protein [Zoogloea sp.]|uniref:SOUL family heme-binding protein n=1 Tax=Zoogloea sp. TaxID=49181 RepID=UPI0035AFC096